MVWVFLGTRMGQVVTAYKLCVVGFLGARMGEVATGSKLYVMGVSGRGRWV
jgi:hypothetical protein